jgi:short-subunit dehydrogenase
MRPILNKYVFGPWAVVTGSSSGIGKASARQLGSSVSNVVLVAHREVLLMLGAMIGKKLAHKALAMPRAATRALPGK